MQAGDVMTTNVITVAEDAPVHEILAAMLKYRISAVPVIGGARKIVGIVSEGDLLRPEGTSPSNTQPPSWMEAVVAGQAWSLPEGTGPHRRRGDDAKCHYRG